MLKTVCLKGEGSIAGMPTPRMVEGKESDSNISLGKYKGYY